MQTMYEESYITNFGKVSVGHTGWRLRVSLLISIRRSCRHLQCSHRSQ